MKQLYSIYYIRDDGACNEEHTTSLARITELFEKAARSVVFPFRVFEIPSWKEVTKAEVILETTP
jgi:hypothetical protein